MSLMLWEPSHHHGGRDVHVKPCTKAKELFGRWSICWSLTIRYDLRVARGSGERDSISRRVCFSKLTLKRNEHDGVPPALDNSGGQGSLRHLWLLSIICPLRTHMGEPELPYLTGSVSLTPSSSCLEQEAPLPAPSVVAASSPSTKVRLPVESRPRQPPSIHSTFAEHLLCVLREFYRDPDGQTHRGLTGAFPGSEMCCEEDKEVDGHMGGGMAGSRNPQRKGPQLGHLQPRWEGGAPQGRPTSGVQLPSVAWATILCQLHIQTL